MEKIFYKATFITGLKDIVHSEISKYPEIKLNQIEDNFAYFSHESSLQALVNLRSITNVFIVAIDTTYNPSYITRHKSLLGDLVKIVTDQKQFIFKNFELSCAGQDSDEVKSIKKYITDTYKVEYIKTDADLKINIGKNNEKWEIGVCLTPRPLTQRSYRVSNIPGSLNSAIAYSINSFTDLENSQSYLNIFSGNATLLIEAALENPKINYQGFDNDGKRISESIKNIKAAGFIKKINIQKANIGDDPEIGTFDIITADLPFGMKIGKNEELTKLYETTLTFIQKTLNKNGTAVLYTTEHELLQKLMSEKNMEIEIELPLKITTSLNSYIYPKIIVYKNK